MTAKVLRVDFARRVLAAPPPESAHGAELPPWAVEGVIVPGERSRLPWRRGADRVGRVRPGDVIGVAVLGVTHEAIVSDTLDGEGRPMLIHASARRGMVTEEPWSTVIGDYGHWRIGYYGARCPRCVVASARARVGEAWDLLDANCQHFARESHGLPKRSPGLTGAAIVGVGLAAGGVALGVELFNRGQQRRGGRP